MLGAYIDAGTACAGPRTNFRKRSGSVPNNPSGIPREVADMTKRTLFFVVFNDGIQIAMTCHNMQARWTVEKLMKMMLTAYNANAELQGASEYKLDLSVEYDLYDWGCDEIPLSALLEEVPSPGLIMAIKPLKGISTNTETGEPEETETDSITIATVIKQQLPKGEDEYGRRLQRFLASPDSSFVPVPLSRHDVFISYAVEDSELATEIADAMQREGLRTFLAGRSIASGKLWANEIRNALRASRAGVLLLTPNSASSDWVMCEAGAFWALEKPIVPALLYVDIRTVPEVISAHQSKKVETTQQRILLVEEIKRLCRAYEDEEGDDGMEGS
jgi:TIR domain